jgi:hypothetical protein
MWQYSSPPGGTLVERPRCWGMEAAFDITSRECRGCAATNSCRDQIQRTQNARRFAVAPPAGVNQTAQFFQQFAPQPTVIPVHAQAFAPTATAQAPVPAPLPVVHQMPFQQQAIQQARPPQAPVQAFPSPSQYGYGWLHDPLYYTAVASPPPMRPQLDGESFFERMMKNVGLAMLESFFLQSFLAVRQLVIPPGPNQGEPTDITPK